jgi:hypothetical protein
MIVNLRERVVHVSTDLPYKEAKQQLIEPFERAYVLGLYERFGDNLSASSRASGLSRKHIRNLFRKYGLRDDAVGSGEHPTVSAHEHDEHVDERPAHSDLSDLFRTAS